MEKRYLERRRQGWYVVIEVPPRLRQTLGKRRIRRTLRTRDLQEARHRRWPAVTEIKQYLHDVRRTVDNGGDVLALARRLRLELPQEDHDQLTDMAEQVEKEHGYQTAKDFYDVATGRKTGLSEYVEQWLSESTNTDKTKDSHRSAVRGFVHWCGGEAFVGAIDRRKAGEYVSDCLIPSGRKPKTINRIISSLSSYWRWLVRRGICEVNPWREQRVAAAGRRSTESGKERSFTDEEFKSLISGDLEAEPAPLLRDLMCVLALSGMRLDEAASLQIQDVLEGRKFQIRSGKTGAAVRTVPIHSDLRPMVGTRLLGKEGSEYIFPELDHYQNKYGSRSQALSTVFNRYRRRVGVDDVVPGNRRSRVNAHSFRRWFITKAETAGQPPWVIETVVGHKRTGMTLGVYSQGPSEKQLENCVEAVRLPAGIDI